MVYLKEQFKTNLIIIYKNFDTRTTNANYKHEQQALFHNLYILFKRLQNLHVSYVLLKTKFKNIFTTYSTKYEI